jgi:flagellar M-ring protein FliF
MSKIEDCYVFLDTPKESSFVIAGNQKDPSATVLIEIKRGMAVSPQESVAIAEIITGSVAGMKPENVRIVDSEMKIYPSIVLEEEENRATDISEQFLLEDAAREQIEASVVSLLTPVFGPGKVAVTVSLALDFDSEVSEAIEFAPPVDGETEGIAVSIYELYENARDGTLAEGVPGTETNGMGSVSEEDLQNTMQYPYTELEDGDIYRKMLREVNYEINKTTTQVEKAKGSIKSLSIAVLIDSEVIKEDYTESVRNLVSKAIGVSDAYVAVERLPVQFPVSDAITDALTTMQNELDALRLNGLMKTGIICATILILVLAAIFLLRSILRRSRQALEPAVVGAGDGAGIDYLAGDGLELDPDFFREDGGGGGGGGIDDDDDSPIPSVSKPESIRNLERMISADPEGVASILRTWLSDE